MIARFYPVAGAMVCLAALVAGGLVGCVEPKDSSRLNAPPQGEGLEHPEWGDLYAYHLDQGMLADRSIADIHFVPGSADLSGTGIARLERYAELLATTGGTLQYDPTVRDEHLIEARVASAEAFLAQAIPSAKAINVVAGLAGGRGMSATEASDGKGVAQQAEKRERAYELAERGMSGD